MNEKVKEILQCALFWYPAYDNKNSFIEVITQQICHLFPKSPDNPDGYEGESDIAPPMKVAGVVTDSECQSKPDPIGVHLRHCYQGENEDNCKYGDEDCPAKPLPKPDTSLEEKVVDEVADILSEYFKEPIDLPCQYCEAAKAVVNKVASIMRAENNAREQRDLVRFNRLESIVQDREAHLREKDAECQARIDGVLKLLPEIPVRFRHNATCFDCVNNIREQAFKEGVKCKKQL